MGPDNLLRPVFDKADREYAGELFEDEAVVRQVIINRFDHPVSITPGISIRRIGRI